MAKKETPKACCKQNSFSMGGIILVLIGSILILEKYVTDISLWPLLLIGIGLVLIFKKK
jgi:hypothetical protein